MYTFSVGTYDARCSLSPSVLGIYTYPSNERSLTTIVTYNIMTQTVDERTEHRQQAYVLQMLVNA